MAYYGFLDDHLFIQRPFYLGLSAMKSGGFSSQSAPAVEKENPSVLAPGKVRKTNFNTLFSAGSYLDVHPSC